MFPYFKQFFINIFLKIVIVITLFFECGPAITSQ